MLQLAFVGLGLPLKLRYGPIMASTEVLRLDPCLLGLPEILAVAHVGMQDKRSPAIGDHVLAHHRVLEPGCRAQDHNKLWLFLRLVCLLGLQAREFS